MEGGHGKNVLTLPKRKSAPLSILQCFGRIVGTKYQGMVPVLMAYLVIMVRCVRDFEGSA